MTLEEVIKTEIEQQYEQYRWIGRQQALVFTFYAAIVAASFALVSAFSKDVSAAFFSWFFVVMFFLGVVGIFISIALISSRGMQVRIAIYLTELLIQITELSHLSNSPLPAIRFRQIPSSSGTFKPRDTAIIPISLAFVFGVSLIFASIALFVTGYTCVDSLFVAICWFAIVSIVSLLGICYVLPTLLEKENKEAKRDHSRSRNVKDWADALRKNIGIE